MTYIRHTESEIQSLTEDIDALKTEQDAIILAHNYQRPEIYDIADKIGDSLELSLAARDARADCIIFCGVDFMAETAKILSPDSRVYLPAEEAQCPMAHMVSESDIFSLKEQYPDADVVSYVNTSASTKALSDICCTSANAIEIVRSCASDQVIFLPDQNLASYVQRFSDKLIIPGRGNCYVHDRITPIMVDNMRAFHWNAPFIAHPECRPEVIDIADAVCSTSGMIAYCQDHPAETFIIGTENGMIERLKREIPEKRFYALGGICTPMKQTTLDAVKDSLLSGAGEVTLEKSLIDTARGALERMLQISGRKKNIPCRQMKKSGPGIIIRK